VRFLLPVLIPVVLLSQINNFGWPHTNMSAQQRISATFDEFRDTGSSDHFHSGTDMPLAPGGDVLSIMAGQVIDKGSDWIRVEDFAYVHVIPLTGLDIGQTVQQGDVVGHTDSYAHIHLNYGGGASGHALGNPLLPGKITPFVDPYHPRSPITKLVEDGTQNAFPTDTISGRVDIIAQAADTTDLLSPIDMNNGIYKIGWALHSEDKSTVVAGPYFWFEADEYYSNSDVYNIYAPGSTTSIYKYIVTNRVTANGYLDCSLYTPGNYNLAVMSVDTRDNWDTTYVPVVIAEGDRIPPAAPTLNYVGPDQDGDLHFEWIPPSDADLAGYNLEFSFNGQDWNILQGPGLLTAEKSSYTATGQNTTGYIEFRMNAIDDAPTPNRSEYSDTYAVRLDPSAEKILVVDGFDRTTGSWTQAQHDFATYYARAIQACGSVSTIMTASNDWVIAGGDLSAYSSIFWFVGDDSRTDETFNAVEQTAIRNYLAGGGALFASGAEIGYDLSAGSTADLDFMSQVLRIGYAGDDANNYTVNGVGDYFSGLGLGYGSTPYLEDWPDHLTAVNGGEVILEYGNSLKAGVGYRDSNSATIVLGFTFETITDPADRSELVGRSLGFFKGTTSNEKTTVPLSNSITGIYPNPFNASVEVKYSLQHAGAVQIQVYDIRGRLAYSEKLSPRLGGHHTWSWDGRNNHGLDLPSGNYIIRIHPEGLPAMNRKLLLLK